MTVSFFAAGTILIGVGMFVGMVEPQAAAAFLVLGLAGMFVGIAYHYMESLDTSPSSYTVGEMDNRFHQNVWDRDRAASHMGPGNPLSREHVARAIASEVKQRLLGRFKITAGFVTCGEDLPTLAVMRREAPAYEVWMTGYVDDQLNGFLIKVPSREFGIRITWPRGMTPAPWEVLYENLCKIDQTFIVANRSRARPLEYIPHGQQPSRDVRVTVFDRDFDLLDEMSGPAQPPNVALEGKTQERVVTMPKPDPWLKRAWGSILHGLSFRWVSSMPDWAQPVFWGLGIAGPLVIALIAIRSLCR